MLINADVKGLEVVCAAELSKDKVLCKEVMDGENIHENNRIAFNLPSRLIAKIFKFRLIYGGSAYSYAHDPDFTDVSKSEKFWQGVIDNYYAKYSGLAVWHKQIVQQVIATQMLEIPSGRQYHFEPTTSTWGKLKWPITTIKNYPVQGFGADLVKLARLEFIRRLEESELEALFIATVHDSLVVDTPEKNVYNISMMLKESIEAVPKLCKTVWDYPFSLPLTCEVSVGKNLVDMEEIKL